MTRRENLLSVFAHRRPEWIPIVGHCDPYNRPAFEGMEPELAEALKDVRWGDESSVIFSRWLGLDIMDWYPMPVRIMRRRVTVEESVDGGATTRIWRTPAGDLREVIRTCCDATGAVSANFTEHLLKEPSDIEALAAIFEDEEAVEDPEALERTRQRRRLIGDDGILLGVMDGTPLGMMYRVYAGVGTLAYLWADAHDALMDLFSVMETAYLKRLKIGAGSDIDAVVSVDDTSTTAISPSMFEECNIGLTNERARLSHEAGKLYFHHSCGHIRDLLPLYRRTAMDGVHAFTVPPVGNVTVAEGRRLLGDRITVMAGLQALAGPMDDRTAVRAQIEDMIRQAHPWDHFVLVLAAYPNRTMGQTRFVLDCCRNAVLSG